ncbi:apolipoprotein N-acyltransferase [Enemella evansiae]|uniref:apolipoprotein N-acyltransferase n=1 Tax=Enemella evansiae TaxID=2016499 RepID=UPI000B979D8A|nr:apolipoprotein N-acyltransferase [Enemella evansiae]OYO05307.1 apolipoprotein N-acyltransferase [Enemella evansiae]
MSSRAEHGDPKRWPRGLRAVALLAAGAVTGLSFQPTAWWPLQTLGVAALVLLLDRRTGYRKRGFGAGYLFGLGLGAVSLNWLRVLVPGAGPAIAAALIAFEALFFGLLGMALVLVRRLPGWPVWMALCWGLCEWIYGRVPFGGFGWIRLVYAQVDSPLAGLLPFLGVSGVSVLAALVGTLLAWWLLRARRVRRLVAFVAVLAVLGGLGMAGKSYQVEPAAGTGSVTIGMVQGNVDGVGIGGMGRARSVTNNHFSETVNLMARARTGTVAMPDFVLWPENSTDIDPTTDFQTRQVVSAASQIAGVPILVGAVMEGPGPDERQTSALWWNPDQTITARYNKRNLVPFGEYIPFRNELLPLIPLLQLVGAQSVPGTDPGVIQGRLNDGSTIRVGDVICFELAYDRTVREAINGSEVLVVQSNNATYRRTPQIYQQFAITRVRAMEARREIVVATTNSVSGLIDRDGRVIEQTEELTSASNSYTIPRREALTPAMRWGGSVDLLINLGAIGALLAGIGVRLVTGRRTPAGPDRTTEPVTETAGNAARGRGSDLPLAE